MQNLINLPTSIDAEQAVVSAVLANNKAIEKVEEFLLPEHFSDSFYSLVYKYCKNMIARNSVADKITLKPLIFHDLSEDERSSLDDTLARLEISGLSIINIEDYGRIIFDRYLRRNLISLGQEITENAVTVTADSSAIDQIENSEKKLYDLGAKGQAENGPKELALSFVEVLRETERASKNPDGISGTPSGFKDLDFKTGGLHNSDLIILAGRPAMGKTALATNIAFNVAKYFASVNNKDSMKSVAFFSLEMSASQLASRVLSGETGVSSHSMRTGKMPQAEFDRIAACVNSFNKLPLYIDDTAGITVGAIRTRARRLQRDKSKGLGLIVIDYLQLIQGSNSKGSDNRVQELSEITRQLKILAKELNIPVIALSQLSRKVEDRDEKIPQLSDLRESGSIEQDADIVMFVYREEYYLENKKLEQRANEADQKFQERLSRFDRAKIDSAGKAEVIIAKQRHGPTGSVPLAFIAHLTKFMDLAQDDGVPHQAL